MGVKRPGRGRNEEEATPPLTPAGGPANMGCWRRPTESRSGPPAVIPTRSKSKLGGCFSYPLGAQEISEALAGVPQFDLLSLTFWWGGSMALAAAPHVVFTATFRRDTPTLSTPNDFIALGQYEKKWELSVYAVLRQHRHAANVALRERALPEVRRWLSQPAAQAWQTGYKRLEFRFSPDEGALSSKEVGQVLS